MYVTNLASNNVSVINTANNTVTAQVPVGNWPYGVAVTPDGTQVYVANYGGINVSVINTSTNTVATTVIVGDNSVAFGQFIGKTAPTIFWANPANIVYGTLLSKTLTIQKLAATTNPTNSTTYNAVGQTITKRLRYNR